MRAEEASSGRKESEPQPAAPQSIAGRWTAAWAWVKIDLVECVLTACPCSGSQGSSSPPVIYFSSEEGEKATAAAPRSLDRDRGQWWNESHGVTGDG